MRRKYPGHLPGECPVTAGQTPGNCPEIDRQFRQMFRRMDFGNAAGNPAEDPTDGGRHCGVIAASNPPENRRTWNPCGYKGFGFPCLIRIDTHFASFAPATRYASFQAG
jgi:hypothetical protein